MAAPRNREADILWRMRTRRHPPPCGEGRPAEPAGVGVKNRSDATTGRACSCITPPAATQRASHKGEGKCSSREQSAHPGQLAQMIGTVAEGEIDHGHALEIMPDGIFHGHADAAMDLH